MAHIVELREMSNEKLEERLEDAREEMFNLRFQKAAARLEDTSRLRTVRREIAQMKEVLHKRRLAVEAAASEIDVARALAGRKWTASARYVYEDSVYNVEFRDSGGNVLATAQVNLNRKQREDGTTRLVDSYEVTG